MSRAGWIRLGIVAGAILLLEVLCRTRVIPPLTMIPPSEMVMALWALLRSGRVNGDIAFSLYNLTVAVTLSVVGGFLIGTVLHGLPRLRRALDPVLSAYYSVPTFVFYPLLIVFLGIGSASLITMGAMFGIVAMIVNTMIGLDRVPRTLLRTAEVLRLDPVRALLFIRIPAASLNLISGAKLAVAYSTIGIVAGEFILAASGVGKRIAFAYNAFDNATMYGLLLLLITFVVCLNMALFYFEKRMRKRWAQ